MAEPTYHVTKIQNDFRCSRGSSDISSRGTLNRQLLEILLVHKELTGRTESQDSVPTGDFILLPRKTPSTLARVIQKLKVIWSSLPRVLLSTILSYVLVIYGKKVLAPVAKLRCHKPSKPSPTSNVGTEQVFPSRGSYDANSKTVVLLVTFSPTCFLTRDRCGPFAGRSQRVSRESEVSHRNSILGNKILKNPESKLMKKIQKP